ncbi:MAG: arsenite methyltransferase [candidate division WOR-3 bacterium]
MKSKDIRKIVKENYSKIAKEESSCCSLSSCCCSVTPAEEVSKRIGYREEELKAVPEGANLGLGCGNPTFFSSLKEGEIVLDLGCGAGFDCFLASKKVGKKGKVIGVDMTEEMIKKARENAKKGGFENVEFKLGEIEDLPLPDGSVDVIISNCVINLSPYKERVFKEAYRVLKDGGRMVISDIVILKELPEVIKNSDIAYTGCVSGAMMKDDYIKTIEKANFKEIKIISEKTFSLDCIISEPGLMKLDEKERKDLENNILSITLMAKKFDN